MKIPPVIPRVRAEARAGVPLTRAGGLPPVRNLYEGGNRWQFGDRSAIYSNVTDARFDATQATRTELVRKARYFEANSSWVQKAADLWELYVSGANGLVVLPDSSDVDWNGRASRWFDEWGNFPDVSSLQSWATLQGLMARTWFIDGEVFLLKTRSAEPPFRPRIQLIEGHRVGTPDAWRGNEGRTIVDGVELSEQGRPVAYWIQDGLTAGTHSRLPAESVIHLFEPARVGMYRGLTHLYAVMNVLHDLSDLELLEMQSAKQAAETTRIIRTPTGELADPAQEWQGVNVSADGVINPAMEYYRKTFGASAKVMKTGDSYEEFLSNRPSVAQQWFWTYQAEKFANGIGIPLVMLSPDSMQGTVYRGGLDMAAAFFRSRSKVLESAVRRVWFYVIGTASQIDVRVADKPADWTRLVCRPPRSPNVDVGRNSRALLTELAAGARTFLDSYAETGEDWKQQLEQKAREAAFIAVLAQKYDVPAGQISSYAEESAAEQSAAMVTEQMAGK